MNHLQQDGEPTQLLASWQTELLPPPRLGLRSISDYIIDALLNSGLLSIRETERGLPSEPL